MPPLNLIWVNGMPRSGTSWLSQIFDSHPDVCFRLSPLFSYKFKNYVDITSSREDWLIFLKKVYDSNEDEFMNQSYRRKSGEYPIFNLKNNAPSNLVIKDTRFHNLTKKMIELIPEIKIVHIIRNPCAAINSWLNAPKEFPQHQNPLDYWDNGKNRKIDSSEFWGFDDWRKLSKMYLSLQNKYPSQVYIIQFEKLVKEPNSQINKLFHFCGLTVTNQTKEFLYNSHSLHVDSEYAVYKQKDKVLHNWKKQLDKTIITKITSQLHGTPLSKFL